MLLNNPTVASKCWSERKSHMSLALNQKTEVIKFGEGGMSRAKTDWQAGLLHQLAKL